MFSWQYCQQQQHSTLQTIRQKCSMKKLQASIKMQKWLKWPYKVDFYQWIALNIINHKQYFLKFQLKVFCFSYIILSADMQEENPNKKQESSFSIQVTEQMRKEAQSLCQQLSAPQYDPSENILAARTLVNSSHPTKSQSIELKLTEKVSAEVGQRLKHLLSANYIKQFREVRKSIQNTKSSGQAFDKLKQTYQEGKSQLSKYYRQKLDQKQTQVQNQRKKIKQKEKEIQKMKQQFDNRIQNIQFQIETKYQNINEAKYKKKLKQNQKYEQQIKELQKNLGLKFQECKLANQQMKKLTTVKNEEERQKIELENTLRKIYKCTLLKNQNSQVEIDKMIKVIKDRVNQSSKLRELYKNHQPNSTMWEISQELLNFWHNNKKPLEQTQRILKQIKNNKVSKDQYKKYVTQSSIFIPEFASTIKFMNDQIEDQRRTSQELKLILEKQRNKLADSNQRIASLQESLNRKDDQLQKEKNQKNNFLEQSGKLKVQVTKGQQSLRQLNKNNEQLKQQIEKFQMNQLTLTRKLNRCQNDNKKLQNDNKKLQNDNKKLKQQNQQQELKKEELENTLSYQRELKLKWKSDYEAQSKKYETECNSHKNTKGQLKQLNDEHEAIKNQLKQIIKKYESLIEQDQQLKMQIKQLQQQKMQSLSSIQIEKQQVEKLSAQTKVLNEKLRISELQIQRQKGIVKQMTENCQNICEMFADVIRKVTQFEVKISLKELKEAKQECIQAITNKIFVAGSLTMQKLEMQNLNTLLKNLQRKRSRPVKGLKLLYRYDHLNTINVHNYIDNKHDLLMVARLINQKVVGGYTYQPINRTVTPGVGFIFSLSTNKSIILQINDENQRARVVSPQDYQIIFGNSELKINQNSTKIFSNVGILSQHFNSKAQGILVTDFLGTNKRDERQVDMINYEFFQVQFQ